MAVPSSGSSHCSPGDDSAYGFTDKETDEEDSTSSPADDVTNKDNDTKAETIKPSRSSTDETTTTSGSTSTDVRRPCSRCLSTLHHSVPTGTHSPFITNVLNNAEEDDITDIDDVDLNGDIDDDGVGPKDRSFPAFPRRRTWTR